MAPLVFSFPASNLITPAPPYLGSVPFVFGISSARNFRRMVDGARSRTETGQPENRALKLTTADLHPSLCPGDDPELINYERFNSPWTGRLGIVLAADLQENGAQCTYHGCPGIAKMLCANHKICGLRRADIPCLPATISVR
uniref:Uncharacterized protein n=1 Tax=Anopheles merus TaxID=30066 RepID=A0A182VG62_ANOME